VVTIGGGIARVICASFTARCGLEVVLRDKGRNAARLSARNWD